MYAGAARRRVYPPRRAGVARRIGEPRLAVHTPIIPLAKAVKRSKLLTPPALTGHPP